MLTEKDRRSIRQKQTDESPDLVKHYKTIDAEKHGWPKECNRVTNSPCMWGGTPCLSNKCAKCGYTFPEWD